jgi:hypothetical protein
MVLGVYHNPLKREKFKQKNDAQMLLGDKGAFIPHFKKAFFC